MELQWFQVYQEGANTNNQENLRPSLLNQRN